MANAVRDAYAEWRRALQEERTLRLVANVQSRLAKATVNAETAKSAMEEVRSWQSGEYATHHATYESQVLLLNTLREHNQRLLADDAGGLWQPVEVLQIAKPAPAK
jgi:hypothetical protein